MTKHTPGPWTVGQGANGQSIVWDALGRLVVTTPFACSADADLRPGSPHTTEAKASNASLIAAAPDLLEALKSYLRAPSVGSDGPGSSTITIQDFNRRAALAAIAKAEGRE